MSKNALMSVVDAAGYAMAAPEDDVPAVVAAHPDEALRNGHVSAAHNGATFSHQFTALKDPTSYHWVREAVSGWLGGKAHA